MKFLLPWDSHTWPRGPLSFHCEMTSVMSCLRAHRLPPSQGGALQWGPQKCWGNAGDMLPVWGFCPRAPGGGNTTAKRQLPPRFLAKLSRRGCTPRPADRWPQRDACEVTVSTGAGGEGHAHASHGGAEVLAGEGTGRGQHGQRGLVHLREAGCGSPGAWVHVSSPGSSGLPTAGPHPPRA